jgi:hypothetical protein
MVDHLPDNLEFYQLLIILIAAVLAVLGLGFVMIWAIVKVRNQPAPAMLTITLGLLTLVSILAFSLTRNNVLGTLAATGLGALAGSLTNVLQSYREDKAKAEETSRRDSET